MAAGTDEELVLFVGLQLLDRLPVCNILVIICSDILVITAYEPLRFLRA